MLEWQNGRFAIIPTNANKKPSQIVNARESKYKCECECEWNNVTTFVIITFTIVKPRNIRHCYWNVAFTLSRHGERYSVKCYEIVVTWTKWIPPFHFVLFISQFSRNQKNCTRCKFRNMVIIMQLRLNRLKGCYINVRPRIFFKDTNHFFRPDFLYSEKHRKITNFLHTHTKRGKLNDSYIILTARMGFDLLQFPEKYHRTITKQWKHTLFMLLYAVPLISVFI